MPRRWSNATITLGAALMVSGALLAYLRIETQLKFVDLTSGNPNWHRPAATSLDRLVLSIPAGSLVLAGLILLVIGWLVRGRRSPLGRR
jgi:hypothetical protein